MAELLNNPAKFAKLCENPSTFLTGDSSVSAQFIDIVADIYKLSKLLNRKTDNDPLSTLLTEGFDEEQIWQQVDLLNTEVIAKLKNQVSSHEKDKHLTLIKTEEKALSVNENESLNSEIEEGSEFSDGENAGDFELKENTEEEVYEKTVVDDNFFSLRRMEKFLDQQENEEGGKSDEEIDYFEDIESSDGEGLSEPESENFDEEMLNRENAEHVSARQLKYDDFFPDTGQPKKDLQGTFDKDEETKAQLDKQQKNLGKKVGKMEEKALAEADWQMKGETTAQKRPVNSLLSEVLQFDTTERNAPEITDEHTHDLESVIIQRIKDCSYDDVQRKIKDLKDPHEYKQKIVLNSEKPKLSLHEIYEKEYLQKMSGEGKEEKEDPAHTEIRTLMKGLFRKLDALSNFHFQAARPEPEIKVVKNLPSIAMEEVQPVHHSEAQLLAPEEVHSGGKTKSNEERTSTDKKRERRKKKVRQKVRSKARTAKLEALAETSEKLKSVQAIGKLQQQAKLPGSQTTIIKNSKQKENLTSSKAFFSKLEENKTKRVVKRKMA